MAGEKNISKILLMKENLFVANRQLKKCQKNSRRLKRLVATLEKAYPDMEKMEKSLKNMTKERDKHLKMLVEQTTLIENQNGRIKELREKRDELMKKLEAGSENESDQVDEEEAPPILKPIWVVAVLCPACGKIARVGWKRTIRMDILEGKCDYCGYYMNAIRGHGNKL